jgi:transposase-like protein
MEAMAYQDYFLQPLDVWQRRYEAVRAVIVDGHSMPEVAQRFAVTYGTVRNWVSEFRRHLDAGRRPPFSRCESVVDRQSQSTIPNRQSPSPILMRYLWSRGDG